MSLVQSARMNGHDPWAYLKDVLTRLPGHLNSRIDELLPHRWQPAGRRFANPQHISTGIVKVPLLALTLLAHVPQPASVINVF